MVTGIMHGIVLRLWAITRYRYVQGGTNSRSVSFNTTDASLYETSKALPSRGIGSPAQYNMPATAAPALSPAPAMVVAESPAIGFSTGGAKNINNFRENIKQDYLPLPTDIT